MLCGELFQWIKCRDFHSHYLVWFFLFSHILLNGVYLIYVKIFFLFSVSFILQQWWFLCVKYCHWKNVILSVQMNGKTERKDCLVSGNKQTKKSGKKKTGTKLSIATFLSDFEKHKILSFNSASMAESPLINSRMWQEWQNWLQALPACGLIGH